MLTNIEWVTIDIIIYNILAISPLFLFKWKKNFVYYSDLNSRVNYKILIFGIIIYSIFDKTGGDYFHYKEIVESIYANNYWGTHLEYPYVILSKHLGFSYELWRLAIWGLALFIYVKIIKLLGLPPILSIWIFILVGLTDFTIVRSSLAIIIFIYGSLLIKLKKRKIIGLLWILISLTLHKSIIVLVPFIFLLNFPINKKSIIFLCGAIIIIKYILDKYAGFLFLLFENTSSTKKYLVDDSKGIGMAYLVQQLLFWIPTLFFLIKGLRLGAYKINYAISSEYSILIYLISFWLILKLMPVNLTEFAARIIWMMSIPISLIISDLNKNKITKRSFIFLLVFLIYNNYKLFYMLYLKKIGLGV